MNQSEQTELPPSGGRGTVEAAPRWKRVLDVTCVVLAAPLWVPLGLLIGLVIKIVSPGPVFFVQERIGHGRRHFGCYKFRTMVHGANTNLHKNHLSQLVGSDRPLEKLDMAGDSRIIPAGKWLRSSGLDELAQIVNVLRGDMSLVGPRPCVPYETEQYRPEYWRRFDVLPGLTGHWQVNGKNRTTFERMIELDLYYVEHRSLWLDLKIMALTPTAVLGQVRDVWRKRKQAPTGQRSESLGTGQP